MKLSKIIHNTWQDERVKELKIKKGDVKIICVAFLDSVFEALVDTGEAKLTSLFSLKLKRSKGRKIRNISTKETMVTKDFYRVSVEPSKALEEELKNKIK